MAEVYNKGKLDILQQEFKQWGITSDGKKGVSFPIVFKNVYALTMGNLNNSSWSPHFRDVTTTGFKATVEGTGYSYHGYWIAIGI